MGLYSNTTWAYILIKLPYEIKLRTQIKGFYYIIIHFNNNNNNSILQVSITILVLLIYIISNIYGKPTRILLFPCRISGRYLNLENQVTFKITQLTSITAGI